MKIAIMQPTYLPWLGYFELIANAEYFVIFDDVQFAKKSWHHRNRIKSHSGELMMVVPVKTSGRQFQQIGEVAIDDSQQWARKHLRSIEINYAPAPFFEDYIGPLREIFQKSHSTLLALNLELLEFLKKQFFIKTPLSLSSSIPTRADRDEKIIDICHHFHADTLYDAKGAEALLDHALYSEARISLEFQEYHHPVYRQLHGKFIPYMSALDLLFNEGARSSEIILSGAKHG